MQLADLIKGEMGRFHEKLDSVKADVKEIIRADLQGFGEQMMSVMDEKLKKISEKDADEDSDKVGFLI